MTERDTINERYSPLICGVENAESSSYSALTHGLMASVKFTKFLEFNVSTTGTLPNGDGSPIITSGSQHLTPGMWLVTVAVDDPGFMIGTGSVLLQWTDQVPDNDTNVVLDSSYFTNAVGVHLNDSGIQLTVTTASGSMYYLQGPSLGIDPAHNKTYSFTFARLS